MAALECRSKRMIATANMAALGEPNNQPVCATLRVAELKLDPARTVLQAARKAPPVPVGKEAEPDGEADAVSYASHDDFEGLYAEWLGARAEHAKTNLVDDEARSEALERADKAARQLLAEPAPIDWMVWRKMVGSAGPLA